MSQIATFFVPISGGEAMQDEMNAFLRGHRVLQVEKAFAGNGWAFCVEWLEGTAVVGQPSYQKRIEAVKDGEPSLEVLKKIDGFGEARLSKYAERLCCFAGPRNGGANAKICRDGVPPPSAARGWRLVRLWCGTRNSRMREIPD